MTENDRPQGPPRSSFSTKALRGMDGMNEAIVAEAWHSAMSVFFAPAPIKNEGLRRAYNPEGLTEGFIEGALFPGFMTIQVAATGQHFSRSQADIAKDGVDGILIQCSEFGEFNYQSGALSSSAKGGDIDIADMTCELEANTSSFNTYSMLLPRHVLDQAGINADQLHLRHLSAEKPLTLMLNRHIKEMHIQSAKMGADEASALIEPTVALLKAALTASPARDCVAAPLVERQRLIEIRRFIDSKLYDPELTPEKLATQFGLSRANLYRLTEPLGGIQRFIRNRRLKHAFKCLTSPSGRSASITNLAFDLGFGSENTFRRLFKEAFGMSPTEARDLGGQAYLHYPAKKTRTKNAQTDIQLPFGELLYKQWVQDLFS